MNKQVLTSAGPTQKATPLIKKEMGSLDMTPKVINNKTLGSLDEDKITEEKTLDDVSLYEIPKKSNDVVLEDIDMTVGESSPQDKLGNLYTNIKNESNKLGNEFVIDDTEPITNTLEDNWVYDRVDTISIPNDDLNNVYDGSVIPRRTLDDFNVND